MTTRYQLKRSTVSGVAPTTGDIQPGELAVNLADRKLFTANSTSVFELGSNLTSLSVGNSTTVQISNSTGTFVNGSINLVRNASRLTFTPVAGGSTVFFEQQNDDNFVLYTSNTTGGSRPVFSVFANTNSPNQNSAFTFRGPVDFSSAGVYANNSLGTAGQVLASNGTAVYWSTAPVTASSTNTLTNKRIDPRVFSTASASSVTPDISSFDVYIYTALAAGLTINATTGGSPVNGSKLTFRFKDNGTPRALTWTTAGSNSFRAIGVTLPTTTVTSKVTYVGCIYNSDESFWDVVAVITQA